MLNEAVFAASPLAQAVLDPTWQIVAVNPAWTAQVGMATAWLDLVHPDDLGPQLPALGRLQAGGLAVHRAVLRLGQVATTVLFAPLFAGQANAEDQGRRSVLVTLLPSEPMGGLDPGVATSDCRHLAAALSHDIRQHARLASVYCSLITRGVLDDRQRGMLAVVSNHADRMQHVLGLLVRWLRLAEQPVERRPCDLGRLWNRATATLAAECTTGELPVIEGDPELLEELFRELAVNAVRYHGGRPRISLRIERVGGYWEMHLDDDGPGIPIQHWERVLHPLHRLQSWEEVPGHGMGLALAERIAIRHGGGLRIVAKSGEGCSVQVRLRV